jgi:tetratricopeptide (TPR) repeat protein
VDRLAEIRSLTEDFLHELTALELILERRRYPELAYMFKHALTQDVAYSLLVQRRKDLHGLVGRAIEELYVDRLPEQYEVLAHHFSKAEDWPRALDYLLEAAAKLTQDFGLRQAIELYGEALAVAARLGDQVPVATLIRIHGARADLFFGIGDFSHSREEAATLVELTRRTGGRAAEASALAQLASALQWSEDFAAAHDRVRQAIDIAESVGAQGPLSAGLHVRGYMHAVSGQLDVAEADLGRSLDIARAARDTNRMGLALHLLALRRTWQGEYREGLDLGSEGVRIAREHRFVVPLIRGLWNQGIAWHELGDDDDALRALVEGLALAEKVGDDALIPRLLNTIGWLRIDCGDFAEGVALSERSYEATGRSARAGHGTGAERRAFIRNNEADAFMAQGDLAQAAEMLEETEAVILHPPASRWMTWRYTIHCYASQAQLALRRGDPDQGRRLADQSLESSVPSRSRKYESWAWRIKGESATMRHAWDEGDEALRRALTIAEAIRQPRQIWLSQLALGRLRTAQGRRDEAIHAYRAAWSIVDALRARTQEPGLRAGFESAPLIREIADLARR